MRSLSELDLLLENINLNINTHIRISLHLAFANEILLAILFYFFLYCDVLNMFETDLYSSLRKIHLSHKTMLLMNF